MRLSHPYDHQYDLPTQMEQLSRDTTEMLLETLGSIPLVGNDIFNDVQYMTGLDWDDKTHTQSTLSSSRTRDGATETAHISRCLSQTQIKTAST